MKFEKFDGGEGYTIGAELEVRIVNKADFTLQNEFNYINNNISQELSQNLAQEFLASMIEINTPVFNSTLDLISYLKNTVASLNTIAAKKNLCLQTSGSFAQKKQNIKINKNQRYKKIYEEHQVLLDNFTICGTHIHIGFENFNKALKAYNYSLYYLPIFVALSASSAFYEGKNTGIHSYRTKVFDRLPKASIPEYFDSYEQMNEVYRILNQAGVIQSTKDIWWDVRIQAHFKTVEFRVCDAVNDFDRLEVLFLLAKALCQLSQIDEYKKLPMQLLKQNMWSATRYSMDAKMVTLKGELKSIKEVIFTLARKLFEYSFLTKEEYEKILKYAKKDSLAQEMIEVYNKTKNIKEVEKLGVFK